MYGDKKIKGNCITHNPKITFIRRYFIVILKMIFYTIITHEQVENNLTEYQDQTETPQGEITSIIFLSALNTESTLI